MGPILQEDYELLESGLPVGSDRRNALKFVLGEKLVCLLTLATSAANTSFNLVFFVCTS